MMIEHIIVKDKSDSQWVAIRLRYTTFILGWLKTRICTKHIANILKYYAFNREHKTQLLSIIKYLE